MPRAVAMAIDHCFGAAGLHRDRDLHPPREHQLAAGRREARAARGRASAAVPPHRRRLARPPDLRGHGRGVPRRAGRPARHRLRSCNHTSHTSDFATHPRRCTPGVGRATYARLRGPLCADLRRPGRGLGRLPDPQGAQAPRRRRPQPVGRPVLPHDAGAGAPRAGRSPCATRRLVVSPGRAPSPPVVTTKARSAAPAATAHAPARGDRPEPPGAAVACSAGPGRARWPPSAWPRSG